MSKLKTKEIYSNTVALGAGQTPVIVDQSRFPRGLIYGLWVRLRATAITAAGGAVVTDYPRVLNAITYGAERPKHKVMTAFSGKVWDTIYTQKMRKATKRTAPTTGSGFDILYYLPFAWLSTDRHPAFRSKDTALLNMSPDVLPSLEMLLGPYTDLWSTATACSVRVTVEAEFDPNPRQGLDNVVNPLQSGDQPSRVLEILVNPFSDLAVEKEWAMVTGGPRECIEAIVREIKSSDGTEQSDIFDTGITTPSVLEFKYGDSDGYNEGEKVTQLDAIVESRFGVAPQAGYHYKMFARDGHLRNALKLRSAERFTLHVNNVATTADRTLQAIQVNTVDIPADVVAAMGAQLPPPAGA